MAEGVRVRLYRDGRTIEMAHAPIDGGQSMLPSSRSRIALPQGQGRDFAGAEVAVGEVEGGTVESARNYTTIVRLGLNARRKSCAQRERSCVAIGQIDKTANTREWSAPLRIDWLDTQSMSADETERDGQQA